ncbi:hypothetical protein OG389_36405 (plasmid) [Streptomyces sp. NBC_00435]|uniref:hypothetical protein n=1 Tax=Streptomyces sp. NBC_00435 TaxID=2903649 RepID=UPI002E1A95C9
MSFEISRRILRGTVVTGILAACTAFGAVAAHADTTPATTPAATTTQNTPGQPGLDDLGWQ